MAEETEDERLYQQDVATETDQESTGGGTAGGRPWRIRNKNNPDEVRYWSRRLGTYTPNVAEILSADERRLLRESSAEATQSRNMLPDLMRWDVLNGRHRTGSLGQRLGGSLSHLNLLGFDIGPLASTQWLGFEDAEEMASIQNRLTPRQRPPGSGATSDFEAKMYGRGIPNLANNGTTNQRITAHMRAAAREAIDRNNFLRWHAGERGTLIGADEAWTEFREAAPGSNWRVYFGVERRRDPGRDRQRERQMNDPTLAGRR